MKTSTQIKFENVVKDGFQAMLKPLGFKKKANNFYSFKNGIGHIINIQKSSWCTKDEIKFTINTAVFVPEVWEVAYNFFGKPTYPTFPTEPECMMRYRIGHLKKVGDEWYDVDERTDEGDLIIDMRKNLSDYILPHFGKLLSKEMIVTALDNQKHPLGTERLIVYGEFGEKDRAKREYQKLLAGKNNSGFKETVEELGKKYGLA